VFLFYKDRKPWFFYPLIFEAFHPAGKTLYFRPVFIPFFVTFALRMIVEKTLCCSVETTLK